VTLDMDWVLVPAGLFVMGKDGSRADETPAHKVRVSAFLAAPRPVTNAEYERFRAATGVEAPPFLDEPRFAEADAPVVGINWFDALAYCEWLSAETGGRCRLPTEAEREWAGPGGREGDWPWPGDRHPAAARIDAMDGPHVPLAECQNGFGLFCMAENVHEWCSDWYDAGYYAMSPEDNPRGPASGKRRASRGGAWRHREKVTRINARSSLDPGFRYSDFGFRVYADV
jgi:formylglycine-generating enzyme required for sulfatase activity